MRDIEWEKALYDHQHMMIKRLDAHRKKNKTEDLTSDERMAVEHSFQLLVASMLDLAKYVLKNHYNEDVETRDQVLDELIKHQDVTYEQGQQIASLIKIRDQILNDYLEQNFTGLNDALKIKRYALVEVLTKEWTARLES
ncbi:HepT-like ribonuclease domain-containing protein [Marinomonas balearica]|uniref:Uncharacterized protein n=1 Tax=Marinomonas balearica TaxID=491947 RepID=A0A4V3CG58_9GAMM|nr:HepT-like ribonuclease domain-containing protein [Marinomonas balearica]TDO96422.1 hypothetical protein DFP79_2997 [Marinomonas balearica]